MNLKSNFVLVLLFSFTACPVYGLCVKGSRANLRTGPGSSHKVSWAAPQYTPLVAVDQKGNWIEVKDQDGQRHWVYNTGVTSSIRCVSVNVQRTNLRSGPGVKHGYTRFSSADKYTSFKRLETGIDDDPNWYRIQDREGDIYWVHKNNVWRPLKMTRIRF